MNKLLEFNKNEVKYFKLNEICEIKRGERITKKDLTQNGYPVMSGGKTFFGYHHKYNRNENTITIAQYGTAGYVNWISEKFWANDVCYCLFPNEKILNNKFLYYVLKNKQEQIYEDVIEATPAHYPIEALKNILIPLPPIEIQNEIVHILDTFTELITELITELKHRKIQYQYYLDNTFLCLSNPDNKECNTKFSKLVKAKCPDGVEIVKLKDICEILTGGEAPIDSIKSNIPDDKHKYPIYSNGIGDRSLWGFSNNYRVNKPCVTYSSIGTIGCPQYRENPFTPIIRLKVLIPKESSKLSPKYLKFALEINKLDNINQSSLANINSSMIGNISIPLPPIEIQNEIVNILDQFNDLTNSISLGLPKEIELRRQQYEYYRNKLLTFKQLEK